MPIDRFSADVNASLAATWELLEDLPAPLSLATEHLLLGLAAAEHETAAWLRQWGLDPHELTEEIHRQYGISPDPLPLDDSEPIDIDQPNAIADVPAIANIEGPPESAPNQSEGPDPPIGVSRRERIRLLRVIDAAANRGREGLRAVEDYVRFVLDDPHLTDKLKRLRHELTSILSVVPLDERLAARETQADVGTGLATPSEDHRQDSDSVMVANFTRTQEALRSLEEFGKILDPRMAKELKEIRYETYTLQRAIETTRSNTEILTNARLYVLIDGCSSPRHFRTLVASLVSSGVHVIQLRDKRLAERHLLERARILREMTLSTGTLFVMNDRADLAVLSRADGVHVGQENLTVKAVRTLVGPGALVGVSTHSIEQARQAVMDGANYIGVGPTFPSGTKQFERFPGPELLAAVASEIRLPAFAIGGIDAENLPKVLSTGIRRVAVGGAVAGANDPAAAAEGLLAALRAG